MRITFALYVEIATARLDPKFMFEVRQLEFADSLDPAAIRERYEFGRVELECDGTNRDLARSEQFALRLAAHRLLRVERLLDLPNGWTEYGRVHVERVLNAPEPTSTHGMEGNNPAVRCPACGESMTRKQRKGGGKPFWGCSQFPACKGTRSISE
jgi:hypothetical protein